MTNYSSKANAKRAAKGRGVDLDYVDFSQDADNNWIWTDKAITELSKADQDLHANCGHIFCPECDVHLSNGVIDFESVIESTGSFDKAFASQKREWSCMGCEAEWGNLIEKKNHTVKNVIVKETKTTSATPKKTIERRFKSTIANPCGIVWDICEEMKGAKRKDVLAKCVEQGIAFNTARTQYQLWSSAVKADSK